MFSYRATLLYTWLWITRIRTTLARCPTAECSSRIASGHHAPCPNDSVVVNNNNLGDTSDLIPWVQCGREPPCVFWMYLTGAKCSSWTEDKDWPTYDPVTPRNSSWYNVVHFLQNYAVNKSIILAGDSLMNIFFAALLCEASRYGLTVHSTYEEWHKSGRRDWNVGLLPPAVEAFAKDAERINCKFWTVAPNSKWGFIGETNTTFFFQSHEPWESLQACIPLADLVFVNYGLHVHDLSTFDNEMKSLFDVLSLYNNHPGKVAVFRELAAQHFEGVGSFSQSAGGSSNMVCARMPDSVVYDNFIWHQNVILAAHAARVGNVPILPNYNISIDRWMMHDGPLCGFYGNRDCYDCTHECITPRYAASLIDSWYHIVREKLMARL